MDDATIQLILDNLWPMLKATLTMTIPLTIVSFTIGLVIALLVALARISSITPLSIAARFYISIIRGTPLLVQLFIVFYALPQFGVTLEPFPAAVIAFSLNVGGYAAEVIRSAILSIPKGQWEAAQTIGMGYTTTLQRIVLPRPPVWPFRHCPTRSSRWSRTPPWPRRSSSPNCCASRNSPPHPRSTSSPCTVSRRCTTGRSASSSRPFRADSRPDSTGMWPDDRHSPPLLQVSGVEKSFGEHRVLRDISFEVLPGTVTVIIGPSGSGKTTVLRTLNALDRADAGVISIGEVSVDFAAQMDRSTLARFRAQSGMVFQAHNLFPHKTVLQNVTEGPVVVQKRPREEARADALALLTQVGLEDKANQYPYQLSGGQQQRVGIARALALKPKLMLFDEPTSALDPELVGEVLRVIRDLATEGWTMVIVTHEIRFAQQVADQVLFIDGGVVLERGTAKDVLTNPTGPRLRQFLHRILDPL